MRNVIAQSWVTGIWAIAQSWVGSGLVLEHIVGCSVEQLSREQRQIRPSSQKIDELFGASFGRGHVREHKGLEDLICNCFATTHVGTSIEC